MKITFSFIATNTAAFNVTYDLGSMVPVPNVGDWVIHPANGQTVHILKRIFNYQPTDVWAQFDCDYV